MIVVKRLTLVICGKERTLECLEKRVGAYICIGIVYKYGSPILRSCSSLRRMPYRTGFVSMRRSETVCSVRMSGPLSGLIGRYSRVYSIFPLR